MLSHDVLLYSLVGVGLLPLAWLVVQVLRHWSVVAAPVALPEETEEREPPLPNCGQPGELRAVLKALEHEYVFAGSEAGLHKALVPYFAAGWSRLGGMLVHGCTCRRELWWVVMVRLEHSVKWEERRS